MIKIAFVIDTIESPTAGTEKQLLMLIQHLDRSKFEPYLCVLRNSEWLSKEFHNCNLVNIGINSFRNPKSYVNVLKFTSFLRRKEIGIVQTQFVEGNKIGVVAAKLAGVKTIISTRRNQGYWHNTFELIFLRVINRWVKCFLANSISTAEWLSRAEKIEPQRITVIHNGLQIEQFYKGEQKQRLAFRRNLGFPPDAIIIGIVANLRPVKAIDIFIKAAKIVSELTPNTRFVIIGEGSEREFLENLRDELNLRPYLCFLGRRLDIPEVLGCLDIGVLSSNSESFSNSIVEYMAAELAVVCTDVGGATEAIDEGVNGYVISVGDSRQMADKLNHIIANYQYGEMGQKNREKALSMFSHSDVFDQYQNLYKDVS